MSQRTSSYTIKYQPLAAYRSASWWTRIKWCGLQRPGAIRLACCNHRNIMHTNQGDREGRPYNIRMKRRSRYIVRATLAVALAFCATDTSQTNPVYASGVPRAVWGG